MRRNSFAIRVVKSWNSLPEEIVFDQYLSSLLLKVFVVGVDTISSGKLFHDFTTLIAKEFLLISDFALCGFFTVPPCPRSRCHVLPEYYQHQNDKKRSLYS
jgi:hypothetical protein